jgi:hypothetical protein
MINGRPLNAISETVVKVVVDFEGCPQAGRSTGGISRRRERTLKTSFRQDRPPVSGRVSVTDEDAKPSLVLDQIALGFPPPKNNAFDPIPMSCCTMAVTSSPTARASKCASPPISSGIVA